MVHLVIDCIVKKFRDAIDTGIAVILTDVGQLIGISTFTNSESAVNVPINITIY